MWPPPSDVCWFIGPSNYSYLRTMNHSEIGVMFTNLAIQRGPHIVHIPIGSFPCDAVGRRKRLDRRRDSEMGRASRRCRFDAFSSHQNHRSFSSNLDSFPATGYFWLIFTSTYLDSGSANSRRRDCNGGLYVVDYPKMSKISDW